MYGFRNSFYALLIAASDLIYYASGNRPTNDTDVSGGAISLTSRFLDSQFSAAAVVALISDNAADTMNVTVVGRNAAGEVISEVKALNGTTEVLTTATFERIHSITLASAAAGTVLVKQGTGGTTRHSFAAGQLVAVIMFQRAAADPSTTKTRYEKGYVKNQHATESLTSSTMELTTDASSNYEFAISGAIDDTESVANRLAAPSGETFVDDGVDQAVPGGGDLAAGEAIGFWLKQTLAAAESAAKETATVTLSGQSAT
jgi:hypothetical protein